MSGVIVHTVLQTFPEIVFPDADTWDYGQETVAVLSKETVVAEFTKQAVAFVEQGGASGPVPITIVDEAELGRIEAAVAAESIGSSSPAS